MTRLRGLGLWFKENLIGVLTIILTMTIGLPTLRNVLGPFWERVAELLGTLAPVLLVVVIIGGVIVLGWLVTWLTNRVVLPLAFRMTRAIVERHIVELKESVDRLENASNREKGRLSVVEERLRIGRHLALNLPDNLPPNSIKAEVQRYERERGLRFLWKRVENSLRETKTGYIVVEHHESGGLEDTKDRYFDTRSKAEAEMGPEKVLIHVIEEDWTWENGHVVVLDIGGAGDPLDPHRERRPGFKSVDHRPDGSCTFRLELQEEGKDESTGREFDWWFERLQNAFDKYASVSPDSAPEIVVYDVCQDKSMRYQIRHAGRLSGRPRRHPTNSSLFEFNLQNVVVTETRFLTRG